MSEPGGAELPPDPLAPSSEPGGAELPADALAGLTPAARRALEDRFLVEAPALVRDALAAAAAADQGQVARLGDALAAEAEALGLGELAAAAGALVLAARAGGEDVPWRLVALIPAWEAARAALGRARK